VGVRFARQFLAEDLDREEDIPDRDPFIARGRSG
jgi:hypothetical protein